MADDGFTSAEAIDRLYGFVIAFILPGATFISFFPFETLSPKAGELLAFSKLKDNLILFVSLCLFFGMMLSAVRSLVFDTIILYLIRMINPYREPLSDKDARKDAGAPSIEEREAFARNFWRYYQFYGNTAVSFLTSYVLINEATHNCLIGWEVYYTFSLAVIAIISGAMSNMRNTMIGFKRIDYIKTIWR